MQHFKQDEVAADPVLQMSVALCAECPESVACKRFMQWLRLNAPGSTNDNGLLFCLSLSRLTEPFIIVDRKRYFGNNNNCQLVCQR